MLSLAFAFGAPCLPLVILAVKATTPWMVEMRLIWIGAALSSALVGGFTLWLGLRALYARLTGGETIVAVSAGSALPHQRIDGVVWHQSGRFTVQAIDVALVCRKTETEGKVIQRDGSRGHTQETRTTTVHQQEIIPVTAIDPTIGPWQQDFSCEIPGTAVPSSPHTANPMVIWGFDVRLHLSGMPDVTLNFPLTVEGLAVDEDDEDEDDA